MLDRFSVNPNPNPMAERLAVAQMDPRGGQFERAIKRNLTEEWRIRLATDSKAALRAMFPLPKDAQELVDEVVNRVSLERLTIVADLITEGLTKDLPNWMAVPELYWENVSKKGTARRVMNPTARGEDSRQDREGNRIPIYCTLDHFSMGIREMLAAERTGTPLDTTYVEESVRRINEADEDAVINGAGLTVKGNSVPGLMNATNVNTVAYTDNEAWTAAGHSGQDILDDVLNMIDALQADNMFGPYTLYVNTTYGNELNKNFGDGVTTQPITILQRLEQIQAGGRNLRVRVADRLAANRTVMVQMTSTVIDLVVGQEPEPLSWTDGPGMDRNWMILGCNVPRVKTDYDDQSGICTGNLT